MTDETLSELIKKETESFQPPLNLYRFQLNHKFPIKEATTKLSYLKELGITTLYLSPIFQASSGSMHGYDVTNPKVFNKELGKKDEFDAFFKKAKEMGFSVVIDVVANHMGASVENPWWFDLLENGPYSIYANYFDIKWKSHIQNLRNKILVPILTKPSHEALISGDIELVLSKRGFFIKHKKTKLPLNPNSIFSVVSPRLGHFAKKGSKELFDRFQSFVIYCKELIESEEIVLRKKRSLDLAKLKGDLITFLEDEDLFLHLQESVQVFNEDKKLLSTLLHEQHFFLEFWQFAPQNINYRRFFDINHLAALKMEDEKVFEDYHTFVFELLKEGKIDGIRIDHPDGLYDPETYFKRLQIAYLTSKHHLNPCFVKEEINDYRPLYVMIEKILEKREKIPPTWNVSGTVGYEYLNFLNGLFVDQSAKDAFHEIYEGFVEKKIDERALLTKEKKQFALLYMSSEMKALTSNLFIGINEHKIKSSFNEEELEEAIIALYSHFPKYRSYMRYDVLDEILLQTSEDETAYIEAFEYSEQEYPKLKEVFQYLRGLFFLKKEPMLGFEKEFLMRFQQLCPSIMAKGYEDTHLYNFVRLVSLNEVGSAPFEFGVTGIDFHQKMQEKLEKFPFGWITTSTHDTKRSLEVRMRINTLSEIPDLWRKIVYDWKEMNACFKSKTEHGYFPDLNMEYFIYQTLVGFWPGTLLEQSKRNQLIDRVLDYVVKAARESKAFTNWVNHDVNYENALTHFVEALLKKNTPFYRSLVEFVNLIEMPSLLSTLSLLNLTFALPGALDIYQGTEFLDFSLVDPDNRRTVDYEKRMSALKKIQKNQDLNRYIEECLQKDDYDLLKMAIVKHGIEFRNKNKECIFKGAYEKISITEEAHLAYFREYMGKTMICISRRLFLIDKKAQFDSFPDKLKKKYIDLYTGQEFDFTNKEERDSTLVEYPFLLLIEASSL